MRKQTPDPLASFAIGVVVTIVVILLSAFLCLFSLPVSLFLLAG